MKKRKIIKKEFNANDRLSDLPESLIFDILRFLPTTDVVRTTILSKHWRDLWKAIPWLGFDDSKMENKAKFRQFVCRAIRSWRGSKMLRFKVRLDSEKLLRKGDIDRWVRFALERGVEDLTLRLPDTKLYTVAQGVYSCSSLKELSLSNCNVQIHGNVQWYQLKSLDIHGGCLISEEAMTKVLCGSPRLESLTLFPDDNMESLSIHSSSLKRLFVSKCTTFINNKLPRMELRISTPNLEYLRFFGEFQPRILNNMPSLSEAILSFCKCHHPCNFAEEMPTQILPIIKHVERVTLSNLCIKVLGGMKEKPIISSFPNAISLELIVWHEGYEQIVNVLHMFPQLRHLHLNTFYATSLLKEAKSSLELEKSTERWLDFDRNLPSSFLLKLRTIKVTCNKDTDVYIIPLIQILLKYASNLEELVFLERGRMPHKILLKIQKSSPDEELIFDHTKLYICLQQLKDAA